MTTYRVNKEEKYSQILNEPLNDKRLSWEARGLLAYLLSKPNGWEVRNYDLVNQSNAGEHKVKRILSELKKAGYMRRYRIHDEEGQFRWITDVYESPSMNPDNQNTIGRKSPDGTIGRLSIDGSTIDGKPHRIVKTESIKTDSVKTEKEGQPPAQPPLPGTPQPEKTDKQPPSGKGKNKQKRPPGVDVYRGVARRYPDRAVWPLVEQTVGSESGDLDFWAEVVRAWIACGWNKLNVKGMLEFYGRRELPSTNGRQNGKDRQGNQPTFRNGEALDREPVYNPFTNRVEKSG